MIPARIQRKRTKGFKLPPQTKCVTRPGPWGNPFYINAAAAGDPRYPMACADAAEAVAKFEATVTADERLCALIRRDLHGFNLACFCALNGEPCHADVLLRIANS